MSEVIINVVIAGIGPAGIHAGVNAAGDIVGLPYQMTDTGK